MKKILVIDDDEDILSLVQMMLSMHDFKVNAISRWEEMDDNIRDTPPDLILLDISLRGADGRDICKRLKNNPVTRHIRVILFSANVHYQFRKFLVTTIPIVRLAGIRENVFVNYLATPSSKNYTEIGYSIDGILRIFRLESAAAFRDGKYLGYGLRFGIATNIGVNFSD